MHNHSQFILSPISDILKDVVSASAGIGSGIETFPMCDYVMQSVFLKMTGSQEQKMKCICWEMATNDFEYRYHFTKMPLGECSTFKDKQTIYKDLIKQIKKYNSSFNVLTEINKAEILSTTTSELTNRFLNTNLSIWAQKSFNEYSTIWNSILISSFANDDNTLFAAGTTDNSLKRIYEEHLYKRRNKIAHNTQSYQQNLPTLKTLLGENIKYENYFVYFGVLILIDKIFVELYKKYLIVLEDN
ncbi:hypothetical protein [Flavobacterium sp.]|uniref:hypothetical protein n=1 Tax=Flavobacterium sp. TaxID=239 RepID=UPI003750686A